MESSISEYLPNSLIIILTIGAFNTLQKYLVFLGIVFIIYTLLKISEKILINKADSEEDTKGAEFGPVKTGIDGNSDLVIFVANIFLSVLLASLLTASFIYLYSIQLSNSSTYLLFILSILSGLILFWMFDFLSGLLSTLIVRNAKKPFILSWPFILVVIVSYPFRKLIERSIRQEKIIRRNNLTFSDLSEVIEHSEARPEEEQEKELMKGVINFSDLEVKEIMRSRVDVVAFHEQTLFSVVKKEIIDSGYSRFPVYAENLDNVSGVLHIKDLLPYISEDDSFQWQKYIRQALFVPENLKINELLKEFQIKKTHIAIIVDEYGGTAGIVTLEDVIEEIVGEIDDEFDEATDGIVYEKISDSEFVFDGKTSLNDFCKIISYPFDELDEVKGDAETLAGLILSIEGKFPELNSVIKHRSIQFQIIALDNRRIQQIKVITNTEDEED